MRYKTITLSEVAKRAGVSTTTASMILSRRAGVSFSKETVEKVLKNHQAEDKHLPIMVQPVLEETLKTLYPGIVL